MIFPIIFNGRIFRLQLTKQIPMKLTLDIWSILYLTAISQGYLLSFVLLFRKRNKISNILLALLTLSITVLLSESLLAKSGFFVIDDQRHFIFFSTPVIYLIGPLFYFYAISLFKKIDLRSRKVWPHFLLFLICFINYLPAYLLTLGVLPKDIPALLNSRYFLYWISGFFDMGLNILQTSVYMYLTFRFLKIHENKLKDIYANHAALYVDWIKKLAALMLGLMAVFTAALLFFLLRKYVIAVENVLALSRAALIYAIGYLAIRQSVILAPLSSGKPAGKYRHSPLPNEQAEKYIQRLLQSMESEKPYLNSDLKLPDLANQLSLSTNQLSQLLNQNLNLNFFDFVNQYRVKEVQVKLLDPNYNHLTNLAIAYEAGFSSKASFHRAFKKHTGKTPSQFVKAQSLMH